MSWEKTAVEKRARIEASIPQEWRIKTKPTEDSVMNFPQTSGIMSAEELAITESSATDLVAQMAAGKLTSVAVTTAFCKRAALAHQLVYFTPFELPPVLADRWIQLNCFLEFFPEMALARAKELDEYLQKNGKPMGPLHGLPISLKDQCRIKVSKAIIARGHC
jgi:amidase